MIVCLFFLFRTVCFVVLKVFLKGLLEFYSTRSNALGQMQTTQMVNTICSFKILSFFYCFGKHGNLPCHYVFFVCTAAYGAGRPRPYGGGLGRGSFRFYFSIRPHPMRREKPASHAPYTNMYTSQKTAPQGILTRIRESPGSLNTF